jgi:archaellum component FlaC
MKTVAYLFLLCVTALFSCTVAKADPWSDAMDLAQGIEDAAQALADKDEHDRSGLTLMAESLNTLAQEIYQLDQPQSTIDQLNAQLYALNTTWQSISNDLTEKALEAQQLAWTVDDILDTWLSEPENYTLSEVQGEILGYSDELGEISEAMADIDDRIDALAGDISTLFQTIIDLP